MITVPHFHRRRPVANVDLTALRWIEEAPREADTMPVSRQPELSVAMLLCLASTALVGFVASLMVLAV